MESFVVDVNPGGICAASPGACGLGALDRGLHQQGHVSKRGGICMACMQMDLKFYNARKDSC